MNDELKAINKQVRDGIAEKERLQGVIETLKEDIADYEARAESEMFDLDRDIESKKGEVSAIEESIIKKTNEINDVQKELTEQRENLSKVELEIGQNFAKNEQILLGINESKVTLKKTRYRIAEEQKEATNSLTREVDSLSLVINDKKEELIILERQISKIEFVKKSADEALSEVNTRNSEQEKIEKELRNKIAVHKKSAGDLAEKNVDLLKRIREANAKIESDEHRQVEAESKRVKAEEDLEVINKKLLSSTERFDKKEEQLNVRAEKLKQTYNKAGIEWPNL